MMLRNLNKKIFVYNYLKRMKNMVTKMKNLRKLKKRSTTSQKEKK